MLGAAENDSETASCYAAGPAESFQERCVLLIAERLTRQREAAEPDWTMPSLLVEVVGTKQWPGSELLLSLYSELLRSQAETWTSSQMGTQKTMMQRLRRRRACP